MFTSKLNLYLERPHYFSKSIFTMVNDHLQSISVPLMPYTVLQNSSRLLFTCLVTGSASLLQALVCLVVLHGWEGKMPAV